MHTPNVPRALAAGLISSAATALAVADENPLAAERWQTRPLIVVSPSPDHPMLQSLRLQLRSTVMQQGFQEREMVLYTVVAGQGRRADLPLGAAQTHHLLAGLGVVADGSARAFLVGKDGGIKLQQDGGDISLSAIFTLIDGMPMRRR